MFLKIIMKNTEMKGSVVLIVCFMCLNCVLSQTLEGPTHGKEVVCYVGTWAAYRPKPGAFEISQLNPGLCTHLIYAFAGLDVNTHSIKSLDPWQDLEKDHGKNGYNKMVELKRRYPHLKVSIAIGGWNEGSLKYSMMAEDPAKRRTFVDSVLRFLETYKFDGLDLDWEFPGRQDGRPQDKINFVSLVKELKAAFESNGYMLTAAFGTARDTMEAAYDLPKLSRYLDFIHMMCYDYHGPWDGTVGANAPLRGVGEDDNLSVEFSIKYMLSQGVSPYKLILGVPLYGRTFIIRDPETKDIEFRKTQVESQGFQGPFTREIGFMGYNEICGELTNTSSKWSQYWNEETSTPYLRDGNRIITYDNPRSLAIKVKMALDYKLGGVMVYSVDTDDFLGTCRPDGNAFLEFEERYKKMNQDPILNFAVQSLGGNHRGLFSKRNYYSIENGRLYLRLPEQEYSNYPLLRTVNDATVLALDEDKLNKLIDKVSKENEVPVHEKKRKGDAIELTNSFSLIVMSLICLIHF